MAVESIYLLASFILWEENLHQVYPRYMAVVHRKRGTDLGVDKMPMNRFYLEMILC